MQLINVNELIPHKDNDYFFDDIEGERWQDFLQSVKTSGIIEPVVITQDKVIVSGHQRVRACKELGIEQIPCRVMIYEAKSNWTKEDVILKDLIETNICQRGIGNINPIKLSRCIVKLEEIYGIKHGGDRKSSEDNLHLKTKKELANDIGMTQQHLNEYKSLQKLTPELQELVETGELNFTTAVKVWTKLPPDEQKKLLEYIGRDNIKHLSQKETEKLKQEYEQRINNLTNQLKQTTEENQELREANKYIENQYKDKIKKLQEEIDYYQKTQKIMEDKLNNTTRKAEEYDRIKQELQKLTAEKESVARQLQAIDTLNGLITRVDLFFQEIAPVKYSRAIFELRHDEVVIRNVIEAVERIEAWCQEMRKEIGQDYINAEVV